jgi:hypothetical protein
MTRSSTAAENRRGECAFGNSQKPPASTLLGSAGPFLQFLLSFPSLRQFPFTLFLFLFQFFYSLDLPGFFLLQPKNGDFARQAKQVSVST